MGKLAPLGLAIWVAACVPASAADGDSSESTGDGDTTSSPPDVDSTSDVPTSESSTAPAPESTSTSTSESTGDEATSCAAALGPGLHLDLQLEHDGLTRSFDLFVPAAASDGEPIPLVVDMHGWGASKEREAGLSQLSDDAEARGYAVAYPAGVEASWNAGFCCGSAVSDEVDDVGFLVAMVEQLASDACVDRRRVYATGFSNGGFMAYRLACEAAATFAAIAPVAGVMGLDAELCAPVEPLSVIHFHGTEDLNVAYEGRPWLGVPGPRDAMAHWAEHNGCAPDPVVTFEQDDVTCETWPRCASGAEVTLCSVAGGGHCWPGNAECTYGTSTTTISASQRMFDMFDVHTR